MESLSRIPRAFRSREKAGFPKGPTVTEYHSLSDFSQSSPELGSDPTFEAERRPQHTSSKRWVVTLLFQLLGLLWVVPILTLLILNFKNHIIGASAWCPNGHCWVDAWNPATSVPQHNMEKFDKDNHNLLGALQLVSKALEVWFSLIATSLVYIVTMAVASKSHGLPIGYLSRPTEFSELPGLLDPTLWTSMPPFRDRSNPNHVTFRTRLYLFVVMTVLLCIVANLMGPATAVLALPSLQWIASAQIGNTSFSALNAGIPPSADGWLNESSYSCSTNDFSNGLYSCTSTVWAPNLDAWIDSFKASELQGFPSGLSQQESVAFTFNYTYHVDSAANDVFSDFTFWAPSRQLVSELSDDTEMVAGIARGFNSTMLTEFSSDYDSYVVYNSSLQIALQRNGPILGALATQWVGDDTMYWTTVVDSQRQIRCYAWYQIDNVPLVLENGVTGNYTRCIRTGPGWNDGNSQVGFSINGSYHADSETTDPAVNVTIFSSDQAIFFDNGTIPSWLSPGCLPNGTVAANTSCDWDRLFTIVPDPLVANRSQSANTIEMTIPSGSGTSIVAADFVAFATFTTYSVDPSLLTNPMQLATTEQLPDNGTLPLRIDPSWYLAAWSVDENGVLPPNRTAALAVLEVLNSIVANSSEAVWQPEYNDNMLIDYITLLPIIQTLSMIEYTTAPASEASSTDPQHPILRRNARLYVWAYSISSRTAILGVVITIIGVCVVLTQFVLGLLDRRPSRSPTELLIAALEHAPQAEFHGVKRDEKELAKVRFHVREDHSVEGALRFHKR